MTRPAGCPPRRVNEIKRVPYGAFLTLSCGHKIWKAGFTENDFENVVRFNVDHHCIQGCYVPQIAMGDDH